MTYLCIVPTTPGCGEMGVRNVTLHRPLEASSLLFFSELFFLLRTLQRQMKGK